MTSKDKELIGNYEVSEDGVVTRREVLLMGALAAGGLAAAPVFANPALSAAQSSAVSDPYVAKDFSYLVGKTSGLSASQIEQHIKLYKGYIGKANDLYTRLKDADLNGANPTYSPLRELLVEESYAVNGAIYHEYYFGNLGGKGGEPGGDVKAALEERYGSTGKFMDFLKASGKCMRGWVIVGYNTRGGHLSTFGLDMHNMWAPGQSGTNSGARCVRTCLHG